MGKVAAARRKVGRIAVVTGAAYVAAVVCFHSLVAAGVVVARLQGRAPEAPASIDIENLRRVDRHVWASAQPDPSQYRQLAAAGVTAIVDLRTGAADDRGATDEDALADLGIDYLRLPVQDGHVPAEADVRRLVELVERQPGIVLVHCGAGVGRSSTMTAGYIADTGGDISLWDTLAVGSVTLDQAWYLTTEHRNPVVRRLSEALDAPRRLWSRIGSLW